MNERQDKLPDDPTMEWIQKYSQKELDEHESAELAQKLDESPELVEEFFEQLYTDFNLRRLFQADKTMELYLAVDRMNYPELYAASREPVLLTREQQRQERIIYRMRRQRTLAVLCSIVLLVGFLFYRQYDDSQGDYSVSFGKAPTDIAVLSGTVDAVWKDGAAPPQAGKILQSGSLGLQSGVAEFLFFNGTRLCVEGPAEISLLDRDRIFSREGNLSAHVPVTGHGFEIQTPHAIVTDLGTEFFLEVRPEETAAHVVRGEIRFKPNNDAPENFSEGQSFDSKKGELVKNRPFPIERFISPETMHRKIAFSPETILLREKASRNGPTEPLLLIDFTRDVPLPQNLIRFGSELVPGRESPNLAVRFRERSDRIQWNVNHSLDTLTLSAWVRLDELSVLGNPILTSKGNEQGGILWQITASGSLSFGIRGRSGRGAMLYDSPIVMGHDQLGQWMHFATVYDGPNNSLHHYMNGRIIARYPLTESMTINLKKLDIGNRILNGPVGNWNGCIESLRIDGGTPGIERIHHPPTSTL